jgi:hypothetical protein
MLVFAASTASAQTAPTTTPTFELSAGYQFLHLPDQSFPFGINVDAMRHYGALGLVAEAGWAMDSDNVLGVDTDSSVWNFGAGPRWTGFGSGSTWPYAQVIVGAEVAHSSVDLGTSNVGDTRTSFLVQPGVGATFVTGDGWGIFGQVDYRRTFFDEADNVDNSINNQFRVYVGVRMILD